MKFNKFMSETKCNNSNIIIMKYIFENQYNLNYFLITFMIYNNLTIIKTIK